MGCVVNKPSVGEMSMFKGILKEILGSRSLVTSLIGRKNMCDLTGLGFAAKLCSAQLTSAYRQRRLAEERIGLWVRLRIQRILKGVGCRKRGYSRIH